MATASLHRSFGTGLLTGQQSNRHGVDWAHDGNDSAGLVAAPAQLGAHFLAAHGLDQLGLQLGRQAGPARSHKRFDRRAPVLGDHAALAPLADGGLLDAQGVGECLLASEDTDGDFEGFKGGTHQAGRTLGSPNVLGPAYGKVNRSALRFCGHAAAMQKNNQPRRDAHEFAARLSTALDRVDGCPKDRGRVTWLASRFSVSQPTASSWLNGSHLPSPERVRDLAKMAHVDYDWLYFGNGPAPATRSIEAAQLEATHVVPAAAVQGSPGASDSVRRDLLSIALRLAAEALGDDLVLTPAQHAEFALILCDLLADGLPNAKVLQFARRTASAMSGGSYGDGVGGSGRPA